MTDQKTNYEISIFFNIILLSNCQSTLSQMKHLQLFFRRTIIPNCLNVLILYAQPNKKKCIIREIKNKKRQNFNILNEILTILFFFALYFFISLTAFASPSNRKTFGVPAPLPKKIKKLLKRNKKTTKN